MEIHLRHQITEANMDRFYCVSITKRLFGDPGVERRWGRVGTHGQTRLDWYDDPQIALNAMSNLVDGKRRKGYEFSVATMNQVSGHDEAMLS